MQRLFFYISVAALLWHSLGDSATAQLVQVAPGYVRAPFVRVYWYPDGSSFVRAPFVGVQSPGYRGGYVSHYGSNTIDFSSFDWRSLSRAVHEWNAKLDADLNRFPSGNFWKSSLKTSEIVDLVPVERDDPPVENVRQQLRMICDSFASVATSPQVNAVASLASFQMLYAALQEYTIPPADRLHRQLSAAAHELQRALTRFDTGAGWQRHLMLMPGMALSDERLASPDPAGLIKAREVFDAISINEEYSVISSLPAFERTRELLTAYLKQPQTSSEPEELPSPAPEQ